MTDRKCGTCAAYTPQGDGTMRCRGTFPQRDDYSDGRFCKMDADDWCMQWTAKQTVRTAPERHVISQTEFDKLIDKLFPSVLWAEQGYQMARARVKSALRHISIDVAQ